MNAKKMPKPSALPTLNTRSYPRTLQEAFGPHTSREILPIEDRETDYPWTWWSLVMSIAVVAMIIIVVTA